MRKRLRIVISCGPTREPLDPVRFLSNYSTGTLGFALARVHASRGDRVMLVHGPVSVPPDLRVRKAPFETVLDLQRVLWRAVHNCDVLYMVAAVSDFKPLIPEAIKIKKSERFLKLFLVQNPDVLKSLRLFKGRRIFVGFSLESKNVYRHSLRKLKEKGLDLVVAQRVSQRVRPFGQVPIDAMLIDRWGESKLFRSISKNRLAQALMGWTDRLRCPS